LKYHITISGGTLEEPYFDVRFQSASKDAVDKLTAIAIALNDTLKKIKKTDFS